MGSQESPTTLRRPPARTGLYATSADAMRIRAQRVRRLVRKMRAVMPWIEESDLPACRAWAEMEILSAMAFAELHLNRVTNAEGEPRRLLTDFR
jgi:hypothetical protein